MKIFAVRHCKAEGQERTAALTTEGMEQAQKLVPFLDQFEFDAVFSSPFKRALDTIKPYAAYKSCHILTDERLTERILSAENHPDWLSMLERTYKDEHLKYPGGESSFEAKERIRTFLADAEANSYSNLLVVTHGNLLSLLINMFDSSFGFGEWKLLSNPDVYLINTSSKSSVSKLWVS
jgi:2,3-bisphosphoglycerate-dependent phosphoglycerate mutase